MLIQTWGDVFTSSVYNLWYGIIAYVPMLILAIVVFIIGWVIASVVGKAFAQVIGALKLDKFFAQAGMEAALSKAGFRLDVGGFIGGLVKWFIIVIFLMTSLDFLGLSQVSGFLREVVVQYIPQVIVAALILMVAGVVSQTARRLIVGGAKAANISSAGLLGSIAYHAIWIFAFIIALSQLGIASGFMNTLFAGIVGMLALAGGLAFGLGGKEAAARAVEHFRSDMK